MHPPRPLPPYLQNPEKNANHLTWFDLEQQRAPECPDFLGLRVLPQAVNARQSQDWLKDIARTSWQPGQSGKEKQHFGPKANFKKRKIAIGNFSGLPNYAHDLVTIARQLLRNDEEMASLLRTFQVTDAFVLRYDPRQQANLDPHIDDTFSYGEVILGLSLESDSILTFFHPDASVRPACVRVPIPAGSLSVMYGPARFEWEHGIMAQDIQQQRTSITLRTLGDAVKSTDVGQQILSLANPGKRA